MRPVRAFGRARWGSASAAEHEGASAIRRSGTGDAPRTVSIRPRPETSPQPTPNRGGLTPDTY